MRFYDLSTEETYNINGGEALAALVFALDGAAIGLLVAGVASITCMITGNKWTKADTENCMATGATIGASIGFFVPQI